MASAKEKKIDYGSLEDYKQSIGSGTAATQDIRRALEQGISLGPGAAATVSSLPDFTPPVPKPTTPTTPKTPKPAAPVTQEEETPAEQQEEPKSAEERLKESEAAREKAQKDYDEYVKSDEHKKRLEEAANKAQIDRMAQATFNPNFDMMKPQLIEDEKEAQLRAAKEQAELDYNKYLDEQVAAADMAAITDLSDEERSQLEQYAVNRIRDQNQTLELQGRAPTAQQEAAALIQKYGQKRVDELAETLMRQQNAELAQTVDEKSREFANQHGFLGSAATIPVAAVSGLISTVGQLQGAARNTGRYQTLDANETGIIGDAFTGAVRGQVQENIEEGLGGGLLGKAASIGYQILMSAADSIAQAYLGGGPIGGAGLAATNSFSQTMADASRNGATPAQAAFLATVNSAIEAASEKFPLDKLIKIAEGKGAATVLKNALRQTGIEAATEEISLVGTVLAELAVMQKKSSYKQEVRDHILNGDSPEVARAKANSTILKEVLNTALVSGGSGFLSGAGASKAQDIEAVVDRLLGDLGKPKQQEQQSAMEQQPVMEQQTQQPVEQQTQQPVEQQSAPVQETTEEAAQEPVMEIPPVMQEERQVPPSAPAQQRPVQPIVENREQTYQQPEPVARPQEAPAAPQQEVPQQETRQEAPQETWEEKRRRYDNDRSTMPRSLQKALKSFQKTGFYTDPKLEKKAFNDPKTVAWLRERGLDPSDSWNMWEALDRGKYTIPGQAAQQQAAPKASTQQEDTYSPVQMDASNVQGESMEGGQIKGTGAAEASFSAKPAYNATLSEENAQADRRSDVRPMELPATDINNNPISATTGNVYGSQNTPEDLASAMEEPVARGDFSYVPISNDTATQSAKQTIERSGGWQEARDNFRMDVEKGLAGAELSARGALILNHAAEVYEQAKASGDAQATAEAKKEWLTILSDVQKLGTNTAQGFQALRIIRNLMPQDKMQFVRITAQNIARDMDIKTGIEIDENLVTEYENATTDQQRDEIMEKIQQNVADQIPSTMLDKWNALRYTNMLGNLKTTVRNVEGNVGNSLAYRIKDSTAAMIEIIANKVSGGKVGRTKSLVVSRSLLDVAKQDYDQFAQVISSGGKYGENNTASSDFGQSVMDKRGIFKSNFKDENVRKVADMMLAPLEGYRKATDWMMNNKYFGDEAFGKASYARALAGFLKANGVTAEQFREMVHETSNRSSSMTTRVSIPEGTKVRASDRQNIGTVISYNQTDDTYLVQFVSPDGRSARVNLSAEILTPTGKKEKNLGKVPKAEQRTEFVDYARAYAIREAQETTFHDNTALARVFEKVKKATGVVGEGIMPFTKTPANVLVRAEEFSPLGIINTAVTAAKAANPNSDVTATDVINSLSKTLTGTAIFALGAAMKSQGLLNGGPDDDEEKAAFDKENGIQDYSINLPNGTTYTLDWLTPEAMPLFMGAEFMDIASDKDLTFADLERVFTSIADPMIQMSMMQGINRSLDSIKYADNNLGQFFLNAAVSYLTQGLTNTLAGQLERSTEEYRQMTYVDKESGVPAWIQQQLGSASQKVPIWDYQQTDYRDSFGQRQKNEGGLLDNLLSPGYTAKKDIDAVDRELYRLHEAGEDNVFPERAETKVTYTSKSGENKEVQLSAEQYQTYAETKGGTEKRILDELMQTEVYESMTDQQKNKVREIVETYAKDKGMQELFQEDYDGSENWMKDLNHDNEVSAILNKAVSSELSAAMEDLADDLRRGNDTAQTMEAMEQAYSNYNALSQDDKRSFMSGASGRVKYYVQARNMGVSTETFSDLYRQYRNIENMDRDTTAKAQQWAYQLEKAVDRGIINERQKENLKKNMQFRYSFAVETEKFDQMVETGVSTDNANRIIHLLDGITGTGSNGSVTDSDKRSAIASMTGVTDREKDAIMKAYMPDYNPNASSPNTTELKYDYARKELGLTPQEYAEVYAVEAKGGKKAQKIAEWESMGFEEEADVLYRLFSATGNTKIDVVDWYNSIMN